MGAHYKEEGGGEGFWGCHATEVHGNVRADALGVTRRRVERKLWRSCARGHSEKQQEVSDKKGVIESPNNRPDGGGRDMLYGRWHARRAGGEGAGFAHCARVGSRRGSLIASQGVKL